MCMMSAEPQCCPELGMRRDWGRNWATDKKVQSHRKQGRNTERYKLIETKGGEKGRKAVVVNILVTTFCKLVRWMRVRTVPRRGNDKFLCPLEGIVLFQGVMK